MKENLQKIFDTVSNHLLTQNEKAIEFGSCKYRTLNGLKCAAGCLIPDSAYSSDMEGRFAQNLSYIRENFSSSECNLIEDLQIIHDCRDITTWSSELDDLKKRYNLK